MSNRTSQDRSTPMPGHASVLTTLVVVLLALLATPAARAGQLLIGAGDNWQAVALRASPGDEILLMPGTHKWARLENLQGTGEKPIVIRGLTRDRPAVIEAEHEGLHLIGVRHVVLKDITISGARINGITVRPPEGHDPGTPWSADLRLDNVTVTRIGPTGERHGVQLVNLSNVRLANCVFKGWGGTAVDIVGCVNVEISGSHFSGLPEFGQRSAVHVRGGSENVRVVDCSMTDTGRFCVEIGGQGDVHMEDGQRGGRVSAASGDKVHLARGVRVLRCVMRGSACPIHFYSAAECSVRNVTFFRPRQWVFAVDYATAATPLRPSEKIDFETNLIMWEQGDLKAVAGKGPRFQPKSLSIGENLWWAGQTAVDLAALGKLPAMPAFPQVLDVDPQLDESLRPLAHAAELFGAIARSFDRRDHQNSHKRTGRPWNQGRFGRVIEGMAQQITETRLRNCMQRFGPRLIALSAGICHDRHSAEEIVQEAFIKLWKRPPDAGEVAYGSWLRRVVTNLSINALQRTRRPSTLPEFSADPALRAPDRGARRAEMEEDLQQVRTALENLDEQKRAILMLRAHEQLSYEEIAEHLGIPIGTVMSRLNRARLALAEELKRASSRPEDEPMVFKFRQA